ncbi:envoplakin a [Thalassophryne amazonica]|uniref:envoplakin a n=1 Tax=Thalassophryne amazonica TaxID=390379 RepID=UPI0014718656|nr:envoplakin a [Thalassophryne amazonica]
MLKKTNKPSAKTSKASTNDLALLIAQMQSNADKVEKNILHSEALLAEDAENDKKDLPCQHQQELCDELGKAEALLQDLFLDLDKVKKQKHPQAQEIEHDVTRLHDRWLKDCQVYRDIFEQIDDVSRMPRIEWGPVFDEKKKKVNVEEYGPTLEDLEKQIAAHNILHKEIEAYQSQLNVSSAGSKEKYIALKKEYNNLLDTSKWRKHYLSGLYEYMQSSKKEMAFLEEEQKKIKQQDWSDRMVNPSDVRRQYETFKNNSLLSHESEVNKLQDEGDRLLELKHPASATIQNQRDDVRNEWQQFLNLCICQETHLDNVEEYKKYQMDVDQLSASLSSLNNNMDPKAITKKSNAEIMFQLEAEEKAVQNSEQMLSDLRRRSTSISPLKQRRINPTRPITVESLCDWDTGKASLSRGDKFTLKSIPDENWIVTSTDGVPKSFPGVCFLIPPPDSDTINKVDLLGKELADIKKRRASLATSLKNHKTDTARTQQSAPVSSSPMDPKALALANQLSNIDADLAKTEENMLNRLRTPLSKTDPTGDLASRLREQEEAARALKDLERQKAAAQADLQPLLSSGTSSSLPLQLSAANNKHDSIAALADLYGKKAKASLALESQIKKVDGIVSGFEDRLCEDGPIPDVPNAIPSCIDEIQRQRKSVANAQNDMRKLSQDLETTEQLCSSLQQGYQEFCPDLPHQKSKVTELQTRYTNVSEQLKERESILQESAFKNQEFQSTSRSLNSYLSNLPTNTVNASDDFSHVNAKQSSQERVIDDLKRKKADVDRVSDLSRDLQNLLNGYEANVDKFNSTREDAGTSVATKPRYGTLANAIEKEEKALVNLYAKTSAENSQLQKQTALAKNIIVKNEEQVQMVSQQQVQLESQQRNALESSNLLKELEDQRSRTSHVKTNLSHFRDRLTSLKTRKGVQRIEEKEVLQYYRDPKLEADLEAFRRTLQDESLRRSSVQTEIETFNKKIIMVEDTVTNTPPKLLTREVTEIERDPQLDIDAARTRDEISRIRNEIRVRDGESMNMKTEVTILQSKPNPIRERVVVKEVTKVERNPDMVKAVQGFQLDISDESNKCKSLNDEIFQRRSQINTLERLIPQISPKVVIKEVKKVEQDPELITESKKLQLSLEEEKTENNLLAKEIKELYNRYNDVQQWKPKIETKEIVNEIYRVDPNTELQIQQLRKDIQDSIKKRNNLESEISRVTSEVNILHAEKPKIEIREVFQEVVKEERSPENEREIQRLNDQVNYVSNRLTSLQDQVRKLTRERDDWKAEKSKVETRIVTKEVIKYEADPLVEKEAERLRRNFRDEGQVRRKTEEMVFDLQNKYLVLERQRPQEKVVVQEVVRLQKDPQQIREHDRLARSLDDEVMSRRQVELEVQQLRTKIENLLRILKESDERQKRIQVESELNELIIHIRRLENAPPPVEECITVEEVLKVERDPKLEKKTNGLRLDMDKETSNILRVQRDIRTLKAKLEILQKEKSGEKTVYKEIVRVEKDQAVEAQRDRMREQVSQQRYMCQDLEDECKRLSSKINFLQTNARSSREENTLIYNRDTLQRERDELTRELRVLETERHGITLSFQQQSKLMSEREQVNRQKSRMIESDMQRLERQILDEKDKIHLRDTTIRELLTSLQKEEHAETRTKETNVSTKITILDPETGKDMSPYDAYMQGLIDRQQYVHLQELECDWEEITSMGPDGETSVLQDRKSGKQYSIKNALREGRLTQYDLQRYKDGKIPISEFALMVAGDKNKQTQFNSVLHKSTSLKSPSSSISYAGEIYPIAGIIDTNTDTCYTVRNAATCKLIDHTTAMKLLEAQAATGGIIDIKTKEKHTVHKASIKDLIDDSQLQRLLNAQKAFTGVEDPVTKERLSCGEAIQKGWLMKENAIQHMQAQHLTGGLVNPDTSRRVSIADALGSKMIDSAMFRELQAETTYRKDITDPVTKEKINYKQALDRCKKDPRTGLPMLPASPYARF